MDIQDQTIRELRAAGHVVIVWTPDEIGAAHHAVLEDTVIKAGNTYLEDYAEEHSDAGQ